MSVNTKKVKVAKVVKKAESHKNFMNGTSYDVSPFVRLQMIAASSFFGEPQYYKEAGVIERSDVDYPYLDRMLGDSVPNKDWREMSAVQIMEKTIDECLALDVEKTLQLAIALRTEDFMRETPQVILVRAAVHQNQKGTGLVNQYGAKICLRGDEPATGLAYHLKAFGRKNIPNSLKKVWKTALESFSDYEIGKYKMGAKEVKTIDVVRLCHASSEAIAKLVKGEAKEFNTYRSIVSNGDNSTEASKTKNWRKVIETAGHMALLRNIRNFVSNGIAVNEFADKLKKGVKGGMQFPFRYYSAMRELENFKEVDKLLEECMDISVGNMPKFEGRVMSLCDNSGSAQRATASKESKMHVNTIANLMGVITGKCFSKGGQVGVFGDKLSVHGVDAKEGTLSQLKKLEKVGQKIGHGTENGIWLFWDDAIKRGDVYDYVFVYSDMQAGHGGLYGIDKHVYQDYIYPRTDKMIDVPKLIAEYRKKVNPNVKVFLVQVAGYEDTIVPEFYKNTYILGGWSDNVLSFAKKMEEIEQ